MKTVGVIGGMGPAATVDFMARILDATPASRDQDHMRLLVDSDPTIPDRNDAIAGRGPSPASRLAEIAAGLEAAGAQILAMPCNTAHAFADAIRGATSVPFIDMIEVTSRTVAAQGTDPVGLLAADGCLRAGIYQRELERLRISTIVLPDPDQARFMMLLRRIKAGGRDAAIIEEMASLARALKAAGAGRILAACTEVPLVLSPAACDGPLIESTGLLADAVVKAARS